jgi:metal-responsive CopG/Arc/MetJ family transcriptional regulator
MTTVSIRLPDELLKETEKRARELRIPRAEYIRRAIESQNSTAAAKHRHRKLMEASRRVRKESLRVNAEFEAIEDAPGA